jgi:Spy/CpxP family protein refolding chaperone
MKENMKTIILVASVALNLVFGGTYLTYKLPALAGVHQPRPSEAPLFLRLDLSPDQRKQLDAERDRLYAQLQKVGREIRRKQINLIDLLETIPPDRQAPEQEIDRQQKEIQSLQGEVQNGVIDHFLLVSRLLTPHQRVRFFALLKSRIQTGLQGCPPMMRSGERRLPEEGRNE